MSKPGRPSQPLFRLALITDERRSLGRTEADVVRPAVAAGVDCVQYRPLTGAWREWEKTGRELAEICKGKALFIVNGDARLAMACGADGVHCGAKDASIEEIREIVGPERWIGYSSHGVAEARRALARGADYVTLSPIFHTDSHALTAPPLGLETLRAAIEEFGPSVVALGGVSSRNLDEVLNAGCRSAAVVSAITRAENIGASVRDLLKRFEANAARRSPSG